MVHALQEAWRVLKPHGSLLDLRPLADCWPVQVTGGESAWAAGQLEDLPAGLADDAASADAMDEAGRRGWFTRERAGTFHILYQWSKPEGMKAYIAERWEGFLALPENVFAEVQRRWAAADPPRHVRVRVTMHIAHWRSNVTSSHSE